MTSLHVREAKDGLSGQTRRGELFPINGCLVSVEIKQMRAMILKF